MNGIFKPGDRVQIKEIEFAGRKSSVFAGRIGRIQQEEAAGYLVMMDGTTYRFFENEMEPAPEKEQ